MDKALRVQLTTMGDDVRAAAIPDDGKQTALWCIGQLPSLYAKYRLTNESRYGEEITRLVQGVLRELALDRTPCAPARRPSTSIPARFQRLHEKFGLPSLHLKVPAVPRRAPV
ncbi:MAG: hypothetical protein JNM56_26815 [Planctomycetia bacterium]|nr:hypothetical protein [Planctomycetia bacterium]